jgi:hypothetical protein
MRNSENTYVTACAILVHAVGGAALGVCLMVIVPKWMSFWSQFVGGVELPKTFYFVTNVALLLRHTWPFFIPIALGLLWLDGLIHLSLLHRKGAIAASLWAGSVAVFLFAALVVADWGMLSPLK